MYLHLGGDVVVRSSDIIGYIDIFRKRECTINACKA